MITIYTRPVCPACHTLKAKLTKEGTSFEAITVIEPGDPQPPGKWVRRPDFEAMHPGARSFPFVVDTRRPEVQPSGETHMVDPRTHQHYDTRTGDPLEGARS